MTGLPQGSVLVTLLRLYFYNEIDEVSENTPNAGLSRYADDTAAIATYAQSSSTGRCYSLESKVEGG